MQCKAPGNVDPVDVNRKLEPRRSRRLYLIPAKRISSFRSSVEHSRESIFQLTGRESLFLVKLVKLRDVAKAAKDVGLTVEQGSALYGQAGFRARYDYECELLDMQLARQVANTNNFTVELVDANLVDVVKAPLRHISGKVKAIEIAYRRIHWRDLRRAPGNSQTESSDVYSRVRKYYADLQKPVTTSPKCEPSTAEPAPSSAVSNVHFESKDSHCKPIDGGSYISFEIEQEEADTGRPEITVEIPDC